MYIYIYIYIYICIYREKCVCMCVFVCVCAVIERTVNRRIWFPSNCNRWQTTALYQ